MITRTCQICGQKRLDAFIGVHRKEYEKYGAVYYQNTRYCLDRPECKSGAAAFDFFAWEDVQLVMFK